MHPSRMLVAGLASLGYALHGVAATIDAGVRDASGKPVTDAVVYAVPVGGAPELKGGKTVAIEQVDREFVPYVSVIQVGTLVEFPNRDPIQHHVYSFSPAKSFEIKLYTGRSRAELFDKPGVVTIGCNIHDWMIGFVLVVPTPYFAKVDDSGHARLRDLRPGAYEIHAWHPRQLAQAAPFAMTIDNAAANLSAGFNIDVQPKKSYYKPPLDRMKY